MFETYLAGAFPQDSAFPVLQYDAFNFYAPHCTAHTALCTLHCDAQLNANQHNARQCMHRYVSLANNYGKMHGTLPSLAAWKELWYFQMLDHDLTGIVPQLPRALRMLYVGQNQFSAAAMIEDMPLLEKMDISDNKLTTFPGEACMLALGTGNNAFCFWSGVRRSPRLRSIVLKNNLIPAFPILSELPSLRELKISANKIKGVIPMTISQLTALTALDLSRNKMTSPLPKTNTDLINLEYPLSTF